MELVILLKADACEIEVKDVNEKGMLLFFKLTLLQGAALNYNGSCFWLAVHGKLVMFWKCISGLKLPCFLLYAC